MKKAFRFDIQKMSQQTGLSVFEIETGLGMLPKMSNIETLGDARLVYSSAPENSKVRMQALKKFSKLAKRAEDIQSIFSLDFYCKEEVNKQEKKLLMEKWISFIATTDEIRTLLDGYANRQDPEFHSLALIKANELLLKELKRASTIEQFISIYEDTYADSNVKKLAFKKWNELAKELFRSVTNQKKAEAFYMLVPREFADRKLVVEKWKRYTLAQIKKANTLEKVLRAHQNVRQLLPGAEELRELSFKKLLGFVTNVTEAQKLYVRYANFHRPESMQILEKWLFLAKSFEEVTQIRQTYFGNVEARQRPRVSPITKKMATFFGWQEKAIA